MTAETGWTEDYRKGFYDGWNNCNIQYSLLKEEHFEYPIGINNDGKVLYDIPKQKPAWSEEDEKNLELVIDCVYEFYPDPVMKYKLKDWLKSLRPGWKPTEEHLSALLAVFNDPNNIGSQTCQLALTDLYEQLKKLM